MHHHSARAAATTRKQRSIGGVFSRTFPTAAVAVVFPATGWSARQVSPASPTKRAMARKYADRAVSAVRTTNVNLAQQLLTDARVTAPANPDCVCGRARAYHPCGRFVAARRLCRRLLVDALKHRKAGAERLQVASIVKQRQKSGAGPTLGEQSPEARARCTQPTCRARAAINVPVRGPRDRAAAAWCRLQCTEGRGPSSRPPPSDV